jgi:hypothetical protein
LFAIFQRIRELPVVRSVLNAVAGVGTALVVYFGAEARA